MSGMRQYFGTLSRAGKSLIIGLGLTWRYLVNPKEIVTIQYGSRRHAPKDRYIPDRHRGVHYLETEKCIMCNICARACPVDCIAMDGSRDGAVADSWEASKVWLTSFTLDFNKCIFCNLCCEPCPKDCIHMGQEFDLAAYTRANGVKNLLTDRPWTEEDRSREAAAHAEIEKLAAEVKARKAAEAAARKAAAPKPAAPPAPGPAKPPEPPKA